MPGTSAEEKRRLRRALSSRRKAVSAALRDAAGEAIARHLVASSRVTGSRRVALYAALPDEVPTRALFAALGAAGLPRLLPRMCDERLEFALVDDWEALRPGPFGVREPAADAPAVPLEAGDAVVVPGVAFDPAGNRLGRGKGYYDRTFPPRNSPGPLLIGAAFADQMVATVPSDSRDRRVDAIVTEYGLRWITGKA